MTTFLLVRHGLSLANEQGFFAGQKDVPLLPTGLEQAKITAKFLTSHFNIDKIYSSDLCRAMDTAAPVAKTLGLPVIPVQDLREIYAGEWEGVSFDALVARYPSSYRIWREDIGNALPDGGESVRELGIRVEKSLWEIARMNPDATVLIATHATPIRCMEAFVEKRPMRDIPWVSNASYSVLTFDGNVWEFSARSQDRHLADRITTFGANV